MAGSFVQQIATEVSAAAVSMTVTAGNLVVILVKSTASGRTVSDGVNTILNLGATNTVQVNSTEWYSGFYAQNIAGGLTTWTPNGSTTGLYVAELAGLATSGALLGQSYANANPNVVGTDAVSSGSVTLTGGQVPAFQFGLAYDRTRNQAPPSGTGFTGETTVWTTNNTGTPEINRRTSAGTYAATWATNGTSQFDGFGAMTAFFAEPGTGATAVVPQNTFLSPNLGWWSNGIQGLMRPFAPALQTGQALPVFAGPIPNTTYSQNTGTQTLNTSAYFTGATSYAISPALPTGASFNTGTGVITWNTATVTFGAYGPFIVTGTNANGTTNSNAFTITDQAASTGSMMYLFRGRKF